MSIEKYNQLAARLALHEDEATVRAELGLPPLPASKQTATGGPGTAKINATDKQLLVSALIHGGASREDALAAALDADTNESIELIVQERERLTNVEQSRLDQRFKDTPEYAEQEAARIMAERDRAKADDLKARVLLENAGWAEADIEAMRPDDRLQNSGLCGLTAQQIEDKAANDPAALQAYLDAKDAGASHEAAKEVLVNTYQQSREGNSNA